IATRAALWSEIMHGPRRCAIAETTDDTQSKSDSRVLGRMGRLGARRHGCVHLCAGALSGAHRSAATLRRRRHTWRHWILRQRAARAVPLRLGPVDGLGTGGRSLRACARADAHDSLVLAV